MDCIKQRDGQAGRVEEGRGELGGREGELNPTPGTFKGTDARRHVERNSFFFFFTFFFPEEISRDHLFRYIIKCIANNRLNRSYIRELRYRVLLYIKSTLLKIPFFFLIFPRTHLCSVHLINYNFNVKNFFAPPPSLIFPPLAYLLDLYQWNQNVYTRQWKRILPFRWFHSTEWIVQFIQA